MSRRLVSLTLDAMGDLPRRCRSCVFWELDPVAAQEACEAGDPGLEKEAWASQALLEWGSCGTLVYVAGAPAGYVMYAPPGYLPGAGAFPTAPVSADAALLTTVYVVAPYAGTGLGRMLVQAAARDVARRGLRAIEAFGVEESTTAGATAPTDPGDSTGGRESRCVAPAGFFRAVGFKTVQPHHRYPRLRLELRTTTSPAAEVGYAWDTLLTEVAAESLLSAQTHAPATSG